MKSLVVAIALLTIPFSAIASDQGHAYLAGGYGNKGSAFSVGGGTTVDILEISAINLGTFDGANSAKFVGLSLVQNANPLHNFNLMFRLGFGEATTTFSNGATARRVGFSNGVYFGIGEQYQLSSHLALVAELNRITYAASAGGSSYRVSYPLSASIMYSY